MSSAASRDSAVKLTTASYQFWVAHKNLRVTFSRIYGLQEKCKKYDDAFSKPSSILILSIFDVDQ